MSDELLVPALMGGFAAILMVTMFIRQLGIDDDDNGGGGRGNWPGCTGG